jgi:hypothetical protein
MDEFRAWLRWEGRRCKVRVEGRENADRLRKALREYVGEGELEHVQDTPLIVFYISLPPGGSIDHVLDRVESVPGARLVKASSRLRVTVSKGADPAEELRYAAMVRRNLWAHSPVDVDPDEPRYATHRDEQRRAYFELTTDMVQEVRRVIREYGHADRVALTEASTEEKGPECLNCGNVAGPVFPTICPNCEMREITPCPYCRKEVPRQLYQPDSGDLFICPECRGRVRIHPNTEMFTEDGSYNPPLFLVKRSV